MYSYNMSSVIDVATKVAEKYSVLSNPNRILILAFLIDKKVGSWSDIKEVLESYSGTVNPNTMQFHLGVLRGAKMIKRLGNKENIIYTLDDIPDDILLTITKEITQLNASLNV